MPLRPARTWIEPEPQAIPPALRDLLGSDLLAQALWRRGIRTVEAARGFLDPDRYIPSPPGELSGIEMIADRLETAIRHQEPVCVWGDFDADGQTSTTALVSTLRDLGAKVSYHIPVRGPESHGVGLPQLEQVIRAGARVILTCDTGITAHEAVEFAARAGVEFMITDHHALPPVLPPAAAIANPRLLPEGHPLSALPGVGVAYKLAEELYRRAGKPERLEGLLDLVALGIVADVASQQMDTRYLLQRGLNVLRQAKRPAIAAMLDFAGLDPLHLSEEHIGFSLGPRLNAIGRLGDANPMVEFFLSSDLPRVRVLAQQLEGLNAERQMKTQQVFKATLTALEQDPALLNGPVIVLAQPHWPAGIIGIVAGRLAEAFGKPALLLTAPEGEPARGSARSVAGIDITQAIAGVQASQPDLVLSFGGHPMAAGLSLASERIEDFRRALWLAVRDQVGAALPQPELCIDGVLPLSAATFEFAEQLEQLAPFGEGNPPLVLLARNAVLKRDTLVGRESEHRMLTVEGESGEQRKVIWWNGAGLPAPEGRFHLIYTLRAAAYNGLREAQLQWIDFQPAGESDLVVEASTRRLVDCREYGQPLVRLRQVLKQGPAQVWCEGEAKARLAQSGIASQYRTGLSPCEHLVIWSAPPGRSELRQVLSGVNPKTVTVFGLDPECESPEAFLKRLAGLAKFTLAQKDGQTDFPSLACASAHREIAVRLGLDWLQTRNDIRWEELPEGEIRLFSGSGAGPGPAKELSAQLALVLEETASFRTYFRQASFQELRALLI